MKIYAWIEPTNIENACQAINPGILIIQPHDKWSTNSPASKPSNNSPAKILPYSRKPKVNVDVNSSNTLMIASGQKGLKYPAAYALGTHFNTVIMR